MLKIVAVLTATLLAASVLAQESIEVHVLELEAVVLDRNGKAVDDLTRDDFEVLLDGKPVPVSNFYKVRRGTIVDERREREVLPEAGEKIVAPAQQSRLIVVFDELHLTPIARGRALTALRNYFETKLDDSTTAMILRWDGRMDVAAQPTKEREPLLRALGSLEKNVASEALRTRTERTRLMRTIDEAATMDGKERDWRRERMELALREIEDHAIAQTALTERTIAALDDLLAMAAGLEGRKVVLYVSEGLPMNPGVEIRDYAMQVFTKVGIEGGGLNLEKLQGGRGTETNRDLSRPFRGLAERAQRSSVIFSALDPGGVRGMEGFGPEFQQSAGRVDTMLVRENESAGLRQVAAESGGHFITNENDLDRAIAVLTGDVSTYYSLGVHPPEMRKKGMDVRIRVKGREDVRVLTSRNRALTSRSEAVSSSIRARLYSREQDNALHARAFLGSAWPDGRRCVAPVQMVVPSESLTVIDGKAQIELYAIALDERQNESPVRTVKKSIAVKAGEPVKEAITFGFQPRRYLVSLAIVDALSGATSYLLTDVDAKVCGY